MQEPPENRTAREVEAFASHMDFLRSQYAVDCVQGREGIHSVPPSDLLSWDPFAELHFMERLLSGTCTRSDHLGLTKHAAAH